MPHKQAVARKQITRSRTSSSSRPKSSSKTYSRTSKSKSLQLKNIFSFPKLDRPKKKNEFSTSFEIGSVSLDVKSRKQGNMMKVDIKIASREFNFNGVAMLSERTYSAFERTFNRLVSNIVKFAR